MSIKSKRGIDAFSSELLKKSLKSEYRVTGWSKTELVRLCRTKIEFLLLMSRTHNLTIFITDCVGPTEHAAEIAQIISGELLKEGFIASFQAIADRGKIYNAKLFIKFPDDRTKPDDDSSALAALTQEYDDEPHHPKPKSKPARKAPVTDKSEPVRKPAYKPSYKPKQVDDPAPAGRAKPAPRYRPTVKTPVAESMDSDSVSESAESAPTSVTPPPEPADAPEVAN